MKCAFALSVTFVRFCIAENKPLSSFIICREKKKKPAPPKKTDSERAKNAYVKISYSLLLSLEGYSIFLFACRLPCTYRTICQQAE